MRQYHRLQKALQKKPDFGSMATIAAELCNTATLSIRRFESNKSTKSSSKAVLSQHPIPEFKNVCTIVGKCYHAILQTISKLARDDQAAGYIGLIVYSIVQSFHTILEELREYSFLLARQSLSTGGPTKKKSKARVRNQTLAQVASQQTQNDENLDCFGQLLTSMIISLDPTRKEQNDILEGLLFTLIEHVGQVLCMVVFKDLRSDPGLRVDAQELPLPGPLFKAYADGLGAGIAERAAQLECRHLVWILERALAFVNQYEKRAEAELSADGVLQYKPPNLFERAKDQLQKTLLKGVFGTDDSGFGDSLKTPDIPSVPSLPHPKKDLSEWFSEEIWRLVGWDILLDEKY